MANARRESTNSGLSPVPSAVPPCIHKGMRVYEILAYCPEAPEIMAAYGLHCFSCSLGGVESLEDGCVLHGFPDDTVDALVDDLNEAVRSAPARPQTITVTPAAAQAIFTVAQREGHAGEGLAVVPDREGGFCMEFRPEPAIDDHVFSCSSEPSVHVFASSATLWRVGGATIDFRDGRFKLELPEDGERACACRPDSCGCTGDLSRVH